MHVWTHLAEKWKSSSNGGGLYGDGMMELDYVVGKLLEKLDQLGIANNTIVVFSTDNGAEAMSWPDGGASPFKGEKGTTFEGGFRVPQVVRWPGKIPAGSVVNGIFSHEDWLPTFAAAVGEPNVKDKLLTGYKTNGKTFKNHLDGYNQLDMLMGKDSAGKRKEIFYFDAGGNLNALRYGDWKVHFAIIDGNLTTAYRKSPSWPIIVNLRQDPYERAPFESLMYLKWQGEKMWTMVPAQSIVADFLSTFKDFPPAKSGSLSVDKVLQQMTTAPSN
jgi:arylsulfatase